MADQKVTDLTEMIAADLAPATDMLYIADVSLAADRKITPNTLITEVSQDAIGTILTDSSTVDFTYNDATPSITASVIEAGLTHDNIGGTLGIAKGGTGQTTATAAFDALAPTTTKGDLVVYNGTDNVRLAAGTNTHVLTANSATATGLEWVAPSSGGAPTGATYVTLTTDATLTAERTLAGESTVVSITDGGAGAAVTVGLAANGVSDAKIRQGAATSVIGRSANSTGNVADIAASADNRALIRTGSALSFSPLVVFPVARTTTNTNHGACTAETAIFTYTVPANALGSNGIIRLTYMVRIVSSGTAGTRSLRVRFNGVAGTLLELGTSTTTSATRTWRKAFYMCNRNATNSQVAWVDTSSDQGFGLITDSPTTAAIDTTVNRDLVVTAQGITGDAWHSEFYLVELMPS